MDSVEKKLNLGCGDDYREDWVNIDLFAERVDKRVDLNVLPLPFDDNTFDRIECHQVLEHLECHPYEFVKEVFRIARKNAKVVFGLPSFSFTLPHLRGYHPSGYMYCIDGTDKNKDYHKGLGRKVSVKRDRFSFKLFFHRLGEFVLSMGHKNIIYEFEKWM